jgi:VWFA-related protein
MRCVLCSAGENRVLVIVENVPSALGRLILALACAGVVCACSIPLLAQSLSPRDAQLPVGPISSAIREGIFRIDAVVTDAAGNLVTDLAPADFRLLDNGQATRIFTVQSSTAPEAESEPLPELIFVFDEDYDSDELRKRMKVTEEVVASYLRENGGRPAQPVFLYRIAHEGLYASAKPSMDGNLLAEEAEKKKEPRLVWRAGNKGPWEHLIDQAHTPSFRTIGALGLIAIDQRNIAGRKVLVWFGVNSVVSAWRWCNFNETVELSTRLREARITVNQVLVTPGSERIPEAENFSTAAEDKPKEPVRLSVPAIALHTGGLVLNSWDKEKNRISGDAENGAIERFATESRVFYSLTFDPPRTEHSDEYHHLAVTVSRPGLTARTVTGYYNQPVYFDHPRPNVERVTVSQLEDAIRREAGGAGFPLRLGSMELTERLTNDKRAELLAFVRNDREREALTALADLSEFLPPPPGETPADPFPGRAAELDILKRTFDYLADSIHNLPDFFATRTVVSYQEPQVRDEDSCEVPSTEQPLRAAFSARGTVLYRNGEEVVDAEKTNRKRLLKGRARALDTRGTFGPVLASVLTTAATGKSTLTWSRWEKRERGNLAIFRFVVPPTAPIFEVTYCCLPEGDGSTVYRNMTGYHGEFAVDPLTGAVMRLAIEADLDEDRDPHAPLIRSALMVEYGPVEIGGKRYMSPVRSVSLSRGRTQKLMRDWGIPFIVYGPYETLVNDFSFSDYHKFGSESRILAGFEEVPESKSTSSGAAGQPAQQH